MNKIIVEVGSTCTKFDKFDGKNIERIKNVTIEFKKNYKTENKLNPKDVEILIKEVNELDKDLNNIYVCGTSIFRTLEEKEKSEFLENFETNTGLKFDIITPEKENEFTVIGATKHVNEKVAVFVGGGGSTEISIYDKGIKEMVNTPMGAIDIMNIYTDLRE